MDIVPDEQHDKAINSINSEEQVYSSIPGTPYFIKEGPSSIPGTPYFIKEGPGLNIQQVKFLNTGLRCDPEKSWACPDRVAQRAKSITHKSRPRQLKTSLIDIL
jgi:hypothetical protein